MPITSVHIIESAIQSLVFAYNKISVYYLWWVISRYVEHFTMYLISREISIWFLSLLVVFFVHKFMQFVCLFVFLVFISLPLVVVLNLLSALFSIWLSLCSHITYYNQLLGYFFLVSLYPILTSIGCSSSLYRTAFSVLYFTLH